MALAIGSGGGSGAGVASFNARTGTVTPATGDYTAAQVTSAASVAPAATQTIVSGADNVTPLIVQGHSATQSAVVFKVANIPGNNTLQVDSAGNVNVNGSNLLLNTNGEVIAASNLKARATTVNQVVIGRKTSTTAAPGMTFGSAEDANLYSPGTALLKTDGTFQAAGLLGNPIVSGALPTVSPVSGTAFQCLTTRDVFLTVPVTFNGAAADATCLVELSPDNVTFSTLVTLTEKLGSVNGNVRAVPIQVPAGWRVKLTVTNATLGTGTYF